jgi:broad specificity phosphatase PhoE
MQRGEFIAAVGAGAASSFPERVVTPRTDGKSRRLFIVRHCQSEANRDLRAEARGDSGLTETGIKQAQSRASHLRSLRILGGTVVSSPLLRASQTAREIATACGCSLSHDARLAECDIGRLEGLSYSEVIAHVSEGDVWVSAEVHGGESLEAVSDRMFAALNAALETSADTIIIVSHAFAIVALLKRLGADALALENGEMIELDLDESASVRQSLHHAL